MKITDYFEKSQGKTLLSFEVLPPMKGGSMQTIYDMLDPLMEFAPPFIDVTYHREEYLYKMRASGYYEKTSIRKRPGTVGICAAIMNRYKVEAVPHLICGGFSIQETENALIDLNFLGIQNILALRGDPRKFEDKFEPEPDGHRYALDLVRQVSNMNQGRYADDDTVNGQRTDFCIGVAGYPEKHFEAPNLALDIQFAKMKIEAGAHYIVTQMFFDNQKYFDYVEACRKAGITVPIVAGLKPLTKLGQLSAIPRKFHVNFPQELVDELLRAQNDRAVRDIGIAWCIQQSRELKAAGVPCIHYYTMGDTATVKTVSEAVF